MSKNNMNGITRIEKEKLIKGIMRDFSDNKVACPNCYNDINYYKSLYEKGYIDDKTYRGIKSVLHAMKLGGTFFDSSFKIIAQVTHSIGAEIAKTDGPNLIRVRLVYPNSSTVATFLCDTPRECAVKAVTKYLNLHFTNN